MKNLFAFLLMLAPITLLAQLDLNYCGNYASKDELITMDVLPVEGETNSCFYVMYYNSANVGEDEVGEMYSGSGNCKKANNRYTVTLDDSESKLFIEFKERANPFTVSIYDGNNLIASLEKRMTYEELLEQYRIEEELMNEEMDEEDYEEGSYDAESEDEYSTPSVYSNEKGWAISMLMYSATEGYFAAVSINEGTNCDMNSIEGVIKPATEQGKYIAMTEDGCVFAEIKVSGHTVTLTEKKCKSLDRGSCPSLSGTYKAAEN